MIEHKRVLYAIRYEARKPLVNDVVPGFDLYAWKEGANKWWGLYYVRHSAMVAVWQHILVADPYAGLTDEQIEADKDEAKTKQLFRSWESTRLLENVLLMSPQHGEAFVEACRLMGYSEEGDGSRLGAWVNDIFATAINATKKRKP